MYCSVPNWRMVRNMHINAVACGGQEWILDSLDLKLQPSNVVSRTQTQVLWESSPTWWTQWKASFQYMSTRAGYPTVVTKFSSTRHLEKIASLFAHKKSQGKLLSFALSHQSGFQYKVQTVQHYNSLRGFCTTRAALICMTGGGATM